jgi:hypothetical protein
MTDTLNPLICDLLAWIAAGERSYGEVMEAWRTSCPRLPVWEEANERGFVTRTCIDGEATIRVTPSGQAFLRQYEPRSTLSSR